MFLLSPWLCDQIVIAVLLFSVCIIAAVVVKKQTGGGEDKFHPNQADFNNPVYVIPCTCQRIFPSIADARTHTHTHAHARTLFRVAVRARSLSLSLSFESFLSRIWFFLCLLCSKSVSLVYEESDNATGCANITI